MADEPRRITDFLNKLNDDRDFRKKWTKADDEERRKMVKHLPQDEQDAMVGKDEDVALELVKKDVGTNVYVFRFIK